MNIKPYQFKKWMLAASLAVFLFSCDKRDDSPVIEKEFAFNGFNRINAGEQFNLTLTKGNSFSIKAKGPSNSVNDIDMTVANNILSIQYDHFENRRPKIDIVITLPLLVQLNLSGAATGSINGFQDVNNVIRAVLSGASVCTFNGAGVNTQMDLSGASRFTITGTTASLSGNLSGASKLYAYDLVAADADISASGGSQAWIRVMQNFYAEASGGSRIYYKGNPTLKNIQTSGDGKVIQE
jgi:hypothetical protein